MDHHITMETDTSYGSSHRHGIRDIIWIIVQHRLSCIVHHMNITDHHGNRHTDIMDHHGTLIIMGTGINDHQEQITIKTDTMDDHGNNRYHNMEHCRPSSPRAYRATWSTADHHHQGLIELQRVGGQTLLSPCGSISTWHMCVIWSSDSWWTHFSWVWSYGLGNDHRAISLIQTSHCLQCYPLWRMVTLLMSAMETSTTCTTLL